jgi:hypothetical protein
MNQFLPEPVTVEEFRALKQVANAPTIRTIPLQIRRRLILLGYATEVLGGLAITDEGLLRIVAGRSGR